MLKHLIKTKATLSFISFSLLLGVSAPALARPVAVEVPVETFHRRPRAPQPLSGKLWQRKKTTDATLGKAVLLLSHSAANPADWSQTAEELAEAGFDVLVLNLRGKASEKILIEDVQSGVVFLKTDARVNATRVSIAGSGLAASGAARYARANKQMAFIVNSLILINLEDEKSINGITAIPILLVDPPKNTEDICKTSCRTVFYKAKLRDKFRQTLLEFLLRPNG